MKTETDKLKETIYELCLEKNSMDLKRFFIKLQTKEVLNSEILSFGLFAAAKTNNFDFVNIIFDFSQKLNINFYFRDMQSIINICGKKNLIEMVDIFEKKEQIITKSLQEDGLVELDKFNVLFKTCAIGEFNFNSVSNNYSIYMDKISRYSRNCFQYFASVENEFMLKKILNLNKKIKQRLIDSVFVDSVEGNKDKTLLILLSDDSMRAKILNSEKCKNYLSNDKDDNIKMKDYANKLITSLTLNKELEESLINKIDNKINNKI